MKSLMFFICMAMTSTSYALPITLSDITGNTAHTETDTLDEQFALTDTSGVVDDATAFLLLESAGYAGINAFGIYDGTSTLEIFRGSDSAITSATLSWDINSDLVTNLTTGFSETIDDQLFGFYLESGDGNTYYSEAALNGGIDMLMTFDVGATGHGDLFGSNYILAWEDVAGGDNDYNDMVVGISDIGPIGGSTRITSVPEPGVMGLMGLGLLGMAGGVRRNQRKQKDLRK